MFLTVFSISIMSFPVTARAPTRLRISGMTYSGGGGGSKPTGGQATANQLIGWGGQAANRLDIKDI
jgi:hypothetical protein